MTHLQIFTEHLLCAIVIGVWKTVTETGWNEGEPLKVVAVTQTDAGLGFYKGASSGGEKSSHSSCILNVEPTRFPESLEVGYKRKNIQYNSSVLP